MKKIALLGSTGSIGTQAIQVCENLGIKIESLCANSNVELLAEQAKKLKPQLVCIYKDEYKPKLEQLLQGTGIEVVSGMEGLCRASTLEGVDVVLNSVVGMVGITPTIEAIKSGKDIALANKETLVTGGEIIMPLAKKHGVKILPVDSEHNAIFQCLQGNDSKQLKRIVLTASGGPFFGRDKQSLEEVELKDVLKHPNWEMGKKITVDSATMMNKGLEVIEACWLFGVDVEQLQVVVHSQSIIHSMVQYNDNSIIAQLSKPDMKLPIQYALTYPDRLECDTPELDMTECMQLSFAKPDDETFVCLQACIRAYKMGGLYPTIVNGANEKAVEMLLDGKIKFNDIGRVVLASLDEVQLDFSEVTLENIIKADDIAREYVAKWFAQ